MTPKIQFMLLVSSYLVACGRLNAWQHVKRAREIPDHYFSSVHESFIEPYAFEFVRWAVGDGPRPLWLPLNDAEQRIETSRTKGR